MKYYERKLESNKSSEFLNSIEKPNLLTERILFCFPTDEALGNKLKVFNDEHDLYSRSMHGYSVFSEAHSEQAAQSKINGFLKLAQRMVGGKKAIEENIRLISIAYDDDNEGTKSIENRVKYNANPQFYYSKEAEQFVVENCLNLIAENPEVKIKYKNDINNNNKPLEVGRTIKGERLSEELVSKNMSNLVILSGSRGTTFAGEVCNCLKKYMSDYGYNNEEVEKILGNAKLVAIGSTMRTDISDALLFKSLLIEAYNDKIVVGSIGEQRFQKSLKTNNFPFVEKINENVLRLVIKNPESVEYATYHSKEPFSTDTDKNDRHHIRLYAAYANNRSNLVPVIIENTIRNMIFSTENKPIEEMLTRTEPKLNIDNPTELEKLRQQSGSIYNEAFIKSFINKHLHQHQIG
jgi:hypothetical protein